jgi:hypothetical protein
MSEETPPPPPFLERRVDLGSREVIKRVNALAEKVSDIGDEIIVVRTQLDGTVTHKQLITWLASAAFVVVAASWTVVGLSVAKAEHAAERVEVSAASIRAEVAANKREAEAGKAEVQKDVRGVYDYLLTRKRQPRLESAVGDEP